jgi:hypothetical protein
VGWITEESRVRFHSACRDFLSSPLRPDSPLSSGYQWEGKGEWVGTRNCHIYIVLRLRMSGTIPPLPHRYWWDSAQEQPYVLLKLSSTCAKVVISSGLPVLSLVRHYMAAARNVTGFELRFRSRVSSVFLVWRCQMITHILWRHSQKVTSCSVFGVISPYGSHRDVP